MVLILRLLRAMCVLWLLQLSGPVAADSRVSVPPPHVWVDRSGSASIAQALAQPTDAFQPMLAHQHFRLAQSALWLRLDLPLLEASHRWYLLLPAAAFTDRVTFYARSPDGVWLAQQAGDHLPVARWTYPDQTPVFALDMPGPQTVYLRLENRPAPVSPRLELLTESQLQQQRYWTFLLIGAYLGFGALVLFLGVVHARLYGDRAFLAYVVYVACMLGFQVAFTGIGGRFFWPDWADWNNMASPLLVLWLSAAGLWFVREVCAVPRLHRGVDRAVMVWCALGVVFPAIYLSLLNHAVYVLLNLYGLGSVLLSVGLCLWAWRQGERYAGWLALGFAPLHLTYPLPALRLAGLLPDSWATQYAVLIGSAIEIPLLLYLLHRRVQDFSENRARLRSIDSTDPLTGLTTVPLFLLRLRDALRRARRYRHHGGLVLVELSNHEDIVSEHGRQVADRALVVAAARLSAVVRDVDTVCRLSERRFALLLEGPQRLDDLRPLAQHIIARGLESMPVPGLAQGISLRMRLVSTLVPDVWGEAPTDSLADDSRWLERLNRALDRMVDDPRKVVLHLAPPAPSPLAAQV